MSDQLLPRAEIVKLLFAHGWLPGHGATEEELKDAVSLWQASRGLQVDGAVGPVSARELRRWVFCGCSQPLLLAASRDVLKWGKDHLTVANAGTLPGLSSELFADATKEAYRYWKAVCGLSFKLIENSQEADIVHRVANLGGPGGVLADMYLPTSDNHDGQLPGRVDRAEPWIVAEQPANGRIDLVRVLCHEGGHAIGIGHLSGDGANLMDPYYSARIRRPQVGDIAEARKRYGPPKEDDPDLPSEDFEVVLVVRGGAITDVEKRPV